MYIKNGYIWGLVFMFFMTACEDDFPVKQTQYDINADDIPAMVNFQSNKPLVFSVQVTPYSLDDVDAVNMQLEIINNNSVIYTAALLDDGLVEESGDRVKYDGIFSVMFSVSQFPGTGSYRVRISGSIQDEPFSEEKNIMVLNNEPPQILSVTLPDTLNESVQEFTFDFSDGNGFTDLDSFALEIFQDEQLNVLFRSTGYAVNSVDAETGSFLVNPSFGAGMKGNKWFRVILKDLFESDTLTISEPVYIINTLPELVNVILQDSVEIPQGDDINYVPVSAKVRDMRGLQDIAEVYFTANGQGHFTLYDDGGILGEGDVIAGDGIYSETLSITSANNPGINTFVFYALDKAGQTSTPVTMTITAYNP